MCGIEKQEVDGRPLRLNMAAERARTVSVSSSPASEATAQDTDSNEVVSPPASETTTAENTDSSELVSPPASETTTEDAGSSELVSSSVSV